MPIRFTFHPAQDLDVDWAADGRQILFHSHRDGTGNMYRQAANGTGAIERLTSVGAEQIPAGVSADGRSRSYPSRPRIAASTSIC